MKLDGWIQKLTSAETPTVGMAAAAFVMAWIALKAARGLMRFILVLAAVALIGGAVWWQFHKH